MLRSGMNFNSQLNLANENDNDVPCQGLNSNFLNSPHNNAFHKMAANECFEFDKKRKGQLPTRCAFFLTEEKN